jgi:hypothetical protein
MSLRSFNTFLLAVLLVGCALLWARELSLREDFASESRRQATLHAALTEEKSRTAGLREDLMELRSQLEKTRAQRAEAQEQALRQAADFVARTKDWQAALRGWEEAVKARDARLVAHQEREKLLLTKLTEAVHHAEEATARAEEMRKRMEAKK